MKIYRLGIEFPYDKVSPSTPRALQGGGAFYSSLHMDGGQIKIQLPECATKAGIVCSKRGGYCDLVYDVDKHGDLIDSLEKLEATVCGLVAAKKEIWFTNDVSEEDIEIMNVPISRSYRSGRSFTIRVQLGRSRLSGGDNLLYDEAGASLPYEKNDISNRKIIPLISLDGLKYTSRSITTELSAVQFMVLDNEPVSSCIISKSYSASESVEPEAVEPEAVEPEAAEPEAAEPEAVEPEASPAKEDEPGSVQQAPATDEDEDLSEDDIGLKEVDLAPSDTNSISIRNQSDVYREIYEEAYQKAKRLRNAAIQAYAKAKEIKALYDIDDDSDIEVEERSF